MNSPSQVTFDMTRLRNKNLPIIWITGQQNTGKKTLGQLIKDRYEFEYINITDLLREEASKETKRAQTINEALKSKKKVSDSTIIDLLKETLTDSTNDKGFVIANFPKNPKQAERFIKEISNVNFIFYFYSEIPLLIERAQEKSGVALDPETLRRDIAVATRDLKLCLSKFTLKIESINTSGLPEETFVKVENALIRRINVTPIKTETDYVQPQHSKIKHVPPPPSLNYTDEHGNKDKNLIITTTKEETKREGSTLSLKKESKLDRPVGVIGDLKKHSSSKAIVNPVDKKEDSKTNKKADKINEKEKGGKENKKKGKEIIRDEEENVKSSEQEQSADEDDSTSLDF